jgi:outer membrane lipoprotein carrier protein
MSLIRICIACFLLVLSCPAWSEEALPDPRGEGQSPSEKLTALVERVRLEQGRITTLEADFMQLKDSSMLVEAVEAVGVFAYSAPDRVRWDYRSPNPISMLIDGDEMITWFRDLEQAERVKVGRRSQRVLEYLGATSPLDDMLQYFSVSLTLPDDVTQPYLLELSPLFDKVAKRLQGVTIWIGAEHFLPIRLRYVDADGDVTDLSFENLRINGSLPVERFDLRLPESVNVRIVELDQRTRLQ